jgi:hypothetical protein
MEDRIHVYDLSGETWSSSRSKAGKKSDRLNGAIVRLASPQPDDAKCPSGNTFGVLYPCIDKRSATSFRPSAGSKPDFDASRASFELAGRTGKAPGHETSAS